MCPSPGSPARQEPQVATVSDSASSPPARASSVPAPALSPSPALTEARAFPAAGPGRGTQGPAGHPLPTPHSASVQVRERHTGFLGLRGSHCGRCFVSSIGTAYACTEWAQHSLDTVLGATCPSHELAADRGLERGLDAGRVRQCLFGGAGGDLPHLRGPCCPLLTFSRSPLFRTLALSSLCSLSH